MEEKYIEQRVTQVVRRLRRRLLQITLGAVFGALLAGLFAFWFVTSIDLHSTTTLSSQQGSPGLTGLDILLTVSGWVVGGIVGGIFAALGGHLIDKICPDNKK